MILREPRLPKNNRKKQPYADAAFSDDWRDWVIERQSKPSTLSRTLSRALNMTVTTVIAGQVKHKNNRITTV